MSAGALQYISCLREVDFLFLTAENRVQAGKGRLDWIGYHALPLMVFGVPLIGFLWELLVGLLCRKNRWLLSLPVLAGALGLALCLLAQFSLSLSFLLGFWAAYGCALLFGWSISQVRTTGDLRWKKWICRGMALCSGAALAVGFGVLILHEMRAANYTMVEEVISGENALSEIPELAIMDTDRKILSALEASSSVQAAIGEGDKVTINGLVPAEHADVQKILSEFLEEGQYQFSEVGTIAQFGEIGTLYYDIFDREEGIRIITEKLSTGDLQKTVTVYSGDPEEKLSVVIYENYEGTFQKIVRQRLWFYDLLQVPEET